MFQITKYLRLAACVSAVASGLVMGPSQARAQAVEEVIVTARKRAETTMEVPVALVTMGKADLERYSVHDFYSLAAHVPGMIVGQQTGGAGGLVELRGVSSSPANPSIDQSVSLNIDGVQVGSANVIRLGQMDLQQIEILKGPQALFFGKNSSGGIITMRSADPGDHLEANGVLATEFNAREYTGTFAVGGPVNESLGLRAVVYGLHMSGYRFNDAPVVAGISYPVQSTRAPRRSEFATRETLIYKPSDVLSIRAKYNFSYLSGSNPWSTGERIFCPNGTPQVLGLPGVGVDDCTANGHFYEGGFNPNITGPYTSIIPFEGTKMHMHLASVEANYTVVPDITLTSVSALYALREQTYGNSAYQPATLLLSGTDVGRRELSEELRLTTSRRDWPVNFTVGGYFQDVKFSNRGPLIFDKYALGTAPTPGTPQLSYFAENFVNTTAYSFFGQAIWKVIDTVELAGGARWSHEEKDLTMFLNRGFPGFRQVLPAVSKLSFDNTSPEVTLRWSPSHDLSIFGSFRNGFKSGGFNTSGNVASTAPDVSYRPETARGFELGTKAIIGDVRVNLTGYDYTYKNMQLSTFDPIRVLQLVTNAASSKIEGLEADATWRPAAVEGLDLRTSVNYSHARYSQFNVSCYTGETIALGCNTTLNPATGAFRQQNFNGRQVIWAPDWSGNVGFSYSHPMGGHLKIGFSGDVFFKSSYYGDLEEDRFVKQAPSEMLDASIRIGDIDDVWELALIGQNLTEVYRSSIVAQVSLTGKSANTGTNIPGGLADVNGQVNRGRQIRLQLTAKRF